jgi:hypothetical protein
MAILVLEQSVTLNAGQSIDNVLQGQRVEQLGNDFSAYLIDLQHGITGQVPGGDPTVVGGVQVQLFIGGYSPVDASLVGGTATVVEGGPTADGYVHAPVLIPADTLIKDAPGSPGDRLKLRVTNTSAGSRTYRFRVLIKAAA